MSGFRIQVSGDSIFSLFLKSGALFGQLFYNDAVNLAYWIFVKFILDNILLIGLVLVSGGALLFPVLRRSGAKVTLLQATQMMNQSRCTILDVRNPTEFATGHIKNAKNIPVADLSKRITELEKQKAHTVITVCASGTRSATASAVLTRAGFANVVSLEGGMSAWQSQGLPCVRGQTTEDRGQKKHV